MIFNDISVSPTTDNTYVLNKIVQYKDVTVPKHYESNGANVPRAFWWFVPPFKPKYLPAVIFHDYLCNIQDYTKADKYFEEILLAIEDSFTTKMMVSAVKLYTKYIR